MKPINDWANIQEAGGPIENLPVGGYVCEIKKCVEKENKRNNGTHLEISFDICEGDYRGWFAADYKAQTGKEPWWRGVIRQNIPNESSEKYEMQCRFFKSFVTRLEHSNEGYTWDWDETKLKGKKIGVVFVEVERESARGIRYMATQPDSIVSVEAVRTEDYQVPEPRMLPQSFTPPRTAFAPVSGNDDGLPF